MGKPYFNQGYNVLNKLFVQNQNRYIFNHYGSNLILSSSPQGMKQFDPQIKCKDTFLYIWETPRFLHIAHLLQSSKSLHCLLFDYSWVMRF